VINHLTALIKTQQRTKITSFNSELENLKNKAAAI